MLMASKAATKSTRWRAEPLRIDPVEVYSLGSSPGNISVFYLKNWTRFSPLQTKPKCQRPFTSYTRPAGWITQMSQSWSYLFLESTSHTSLEKALGPPMTLSSRHLPSSLLKLCQMKAMGLWAFKRELLLLNQLKTSFIRHSLSCIPSLEL